MSFGEMPNVQAKPCVPQTNLYKRTMPVTGPRFLIDPKSGQGLPATQAVAVGLKPDLHLSALLV
jgi:hypothetical protein